MNDSQSWILDSRCNEQLRVVVDRKTLSCEVKALNAMNNSKLWLTWMTLGHELRALDAINSSGLLMTWGTLGHELKALDGMNSFGLWLTRTTSGCEFRAPDAMNNSELSMKWKTMGHELRIKVVVDMNYSRSWAHGSNCYKQLRVVDNMD